MFGRTQAPNPIVSRRRCRNLEIWLDVLLDLDKEFVIYCSISKRLRLAESLWSSFKQNEVYFMGGGAAGGLWRHQQWSPSWPPSWILPSIRNQIKTTRNSNFMYFTSKIKHNYTLNEFSHLLSKEVRKTCIFTQKWLDHLPLMMLYLVTITTDHHWTRLEICAREERTATTNVRCWCFIL